MDSGGAEKKNGVGMSNCFPAGGADFRNVDCAIGDDFGDFSAKFLQARNKFGGSAIASRKKYTFPAELECKLVDKSCGGSALADVGNFETSQLRCFGRGFADGRDFGSGWEITAIDSERGETLGDGGNCVLACEKQPVEICECAKSGIELGVV